MKKLVIAAAMVTVAIALGAQASPLKTTAGMRSGFPIPSCLPGQVLVPVYVDGKIIRYVCGGNPTGPQ